MRPGVLDELGLVPALGWIGEHTLRPLGIDIHLERRSEVAVMTLSDDGRCLEPGKASPTTERARGLGLAGMRERASLLGGQVQVESVIGKGTRIRVSIPLPVETSSALEPQPFKTRL